MSPSLGALAGYFLKLGTVGFGGPIALVGYMQRDLVERRRWITGREYTEGLAFSQMAPGPLAAQLAMYLSWARAGALGAALSGLAFVLPSFVMVLAISVLYVRHQGLWWMQGAFYGIGAAVMAIIARSVVKLGKMSLRRDAQLWALAAVNAFVVAATQREILWVFFASGLVTLLARIGIRPATAAAGCAVPLWLCPAGVAQISAPRLLDVFWFFTKAGTVVFGSGLAIVPFLYGGAVQQYGWLTERQFLDAIAVSMITPGPVVITVAFVGYLAAGMSGALLASVGVFLPVYLSVVLLAPWFHRFAKNPQVAAFVDGVTAAATGALAGAAVVIGQRAITDWPGVAIAATTLLLLVSRRRVPELALIGGAGAVGILLG